jgi:hypothetical protein
LYQYLAEFKVRTTRTVEWIAIPVCNLERVDVPEHVHLESEGIAPYVTNGSYAVITEPHTAFGNGPIVLTAHYDDEVDASVCATHSALWLLKNTGEDFIHWSGEKVMAPFC